jgi:alpha-galactosidase
VNKGGVWNGFHGKDANFWSPHPVRFPNGIKPLADLAAGKGMQLSLWFAPDSSDG